MDNNQDKLYLMVDGQEKVYDVYFSFTCPQTNKGYIAYSEHKTDENGNEIILKSVYDPNVSDKQLLPVTDPKEDELFQKVYEKIEKIA